MIYRNTFRVWDSVTWRDDHYAELADARKRHGDGPFHIEKVYDLTRGIRAVGHLQQVVVHGEVFSGAFFRRVNETVEEASR